MIGPRQEGHVETLARAKAGLIDQRESRQTIERIASGSTRDGQAAVYHLEGGESITGAGESRKSGTVQTSSVQRI